MITFDGYPQFVKYLNALNAVGGIAVLPSTASAQASLSPLWPMEELYGPRKDGYQKIIEGKPPVVQVSRRSWLPGRVPDVKPWSLHQRCRHSYRWRLYCQLF
ncbi:MAG: hypothetical protein LKK01_02325 [Prevotella sp.]|nr:hypothetical protein [Prevotella sp.]MCI2101476.1 hypothetical protein [Prevotella sp.]